MSAVKDAQPAKNGGKQKILICLLRLDLRLHDNALFHFAHAAEAPSEVDESIGARQFNVERFSDERQLHSSATHLLPVFVFDEREIELSGLPNYQRKGPEARTQQYGFWKTGSFRARFVSESVYDVRSRLRDAGSDMLIRFGRPEDVIKNLVQAFQDQGDEVEGVWLQKEMTSQEVRIEGAIVERMKPLGVPVSFVYGKTLIHPADLPFEIGETPDVFTPFRKKVEALGPKMVRPCWTVPDRFKPYPSIPSTPDYSLDVSYEIDVDGLSSRAPESKEKEAEQTSYHDILRYLLKPLNQAPMPFASDGTVLLQQRHPASAFPLRGGESSALDRLEWYFIRGKSHDSSRWGKADPPPVARYKQTRNNLLGHAYSTKMSPFLAYGSVSPRQIWDALNYHEQKFGEDQNTYWVRFELLWRDYFFFVAEKFGDLLFHLGGFELATDPRQAEKKLEPGWWKMYSESDGPEHPITRLLEGRTGIPFIDANILELRESGFMSNRGRQNIASFLSKDLGYDWRLGAEFFQSHLIDYDPTSNYGNWQYVAGCGNDPRASRQFNCVKQAKDYDSHGEYVKMWIPALRNLHPDHVHTPWLLDPEERRSYGLKTSQMSVTIDAYPERPMLEHDSWHKHYSRKEGVGSKMFGNPQEKVKDGKVKRYKKPVAPRSGKIPQSNEANGMEMGRNGPSMMGPSFLPSDYPLPGSNPNSGALSLGSEGNGMGYVSASAGTYSRGNGTTSNGAAGLNERNVIPPLRGTRGSIGPNVQRAASPAGSHFTSSGTTTPTLGGGSSRSIGGVRGLVGGPLASLGTSSSSDSSSGSKADKETSWRRGPSSSS